MEGISRIVRFIIDILRRDLIRLSSHFFMYRNLRARAVPNGYSERINHAASTPFSSCVNAYRDNFKLGQESASQMTIRYHDEIVVNMCGFNDSESITSEDESLYPITSCGGVLESLVIAMLCDRKFLDYNSTIAQYWPEFGIALSKTITVSMLMKHQARLWRIQSPFKSLDHAKTIFRNVSSLEQWVLRSLTVDTSISKNECAFHAITRGIIVDILVSRVCGVRFTDYLILHVLEPLGIVNKVVNGGNRASHNQVVCKPMLKRWYITHNMYKLLASPVLKTTRKLWNYSDEEFYYSHYTQSETAMIFDILTSNTTNQVMQLTETASVFPHKMVNNPAFRTLPVSSLGMLATSEALCAIANELAQGGGILLSKRGFNSAIACEHEPRYDRFSHERISFTRCGWSRDHLKPGWIGWGGLGGSAMLFSPDFNAAFVYLPTKMDLRTHCPNARRILDKLDEIVSVIQ